MENHVKWRKSCLDSSTRLVGTLSPGWYVAWESSIGTA